MGLTERAGEVQMATGVAHLALGVAEYRQSLLAIARDGAIGAVAGDREREVAFWFLTSGAGLLMGGALARWAQRRVGTLPAVHGLGLLAVGLTGAALLPRSGFWLVAANGALALAASRRRGEKAG